MWKSTIQIRADKTLDERERSVKNRVVSGEWKGQTETKEVEISGWNSDVWDLGKEDAENLGDKWVWNNWDKHGNKLNGGELWKSR